MKSVVVEIKDGFAAVLSDDGSIVKVKNKNYVIGQVIGMKNQKRYFTKKVAMIAASAATVAVVSGVGVWAYSTPYTYVSLDVNPSIEYEVNRFGVVIDVAAVNDDGQAIVDELNVEDLNNKFIEEAIQQTVEQITEEGYFAGTTTEEGKDTEAVSDEVTTTDSVTGDEVAPVTGSEESSENADDTLNGGIVITVSNMDGNTESSEGLAEEIRNVVNEVVPENVEMEVSSIGYKRVQEARALGVTPGKLNLVQKLQASVKDAGSISTEEWLKKPVKEIMKQIKANKKADASKVENQPEVKEENAPDTTVAPDDAVTVTTEDNQDKEVEAVSLEEQKKVKGQAKVAAKEEEKNAAEAARKVEKDTKAAAKAEEKQVKETAKEAEKIAKGAEKAEQKKAKEVEDTEEEADESESGNQSQDKKSHGSEQGKGNAKKR